MKLIKIAFEKLAGRDDYLRDLGASEDIVSYIMSLEGKHSHYLTNAFRQNPGLTLSDLQGMRPPEDLSAIREMENKLVERFPDGMKKWLIYQIRRRIRIGENILPNDERYGRYFYEYLNQGTYDMIDWFRAVEPDLSNLSLREAEVASEQWHDDMAAGGAGKIYQESNILYGPTWTDSEGNVKEEYEGWTIQEITTENDLLAEGHFMDHCVGSYWNNQMEFIVGNNADPARIFSLRDPGNKPHVTIEADKSGESANQIQGKSNTEPKDEYKAMIKFWVEHGGSTLKTITDDHDEFGYYVQASDYEGIGRYVDRLSKFLDGTTGEYGLKMDSMPVYEDAIDSILAEGTKMVQTFHKRSHGYHGDGGLSDMLARYAVGEGDEAIDYLIKSLEEYSDSANDWFYSNESGLSYPDDDDFMDEEGEFNEEEYNIAVNEYEEREDQMRNDFWPTAWNGDLYKSLMEEFKKVRGEEIWPWYSRYNAEKKREKVDYIEDQENEMSMAKSWYDLFKAGI